KNNDVQFPNREPLLVGAWYLTVTFTNEEGDTVTFTSMQTYHAGSTQPNRGTMSDRSDSPGNVEGTGSGVWAGSGRRFSTTVENCEYDEHAMLTGRVHVRTATRIESEDHLSARFTVDFILPDGSVVPNVARGTFQATRLKVEPLNHH